MPQTEPIQLPLRDYEAWTLIRVLAAAIEDEEMDPQQRARCRWVQQRLIRLTPGRNGE
jgi:hypothetical protein